MILLRLAILCLAAALLAPPALVAQTPYRILVTNDDGVRAPGILAVAQALGQIGTVQIVAPADNQSGKGHSISITDPVYVDPVTLPGGLAAFGVTATPASAVKVALMALLTERPHLVVSGINRGANLGMSAYISGTVGAAREGALHGLPAIAISQVTAGGWNDYSAAASAAVELAALVKAHPLPRGVFLNVNVPAGTPKGLRVATQSRLLGQERWVERTNPRGRRYLWNEYEDDETDVEGTDIWAVGQGYVAVTPLQALEYDAPAADALRKLIRP